MSLNANDKFDPKRYGLITGSKCSVLFPKRSAEVGQRTYAKQLANQMYFRYYDDIGTWQTEHGNLSESSAFEYYKEHYDDTAEYTPDFKSIGDWGGSADCLTKTKGQDFKCPTSLEKWLDYLHEGISKDQYYQAQMYMMLYDRDVWQICAFLLETNRMSEMGEVYPVPYEKRMIIFEVEKDKAWFDQLVKETPKVIEMRDWFYNKLKENFD